MQFTQGMKKRFVLQFRWSSVVMLGAVLALCFLMGNSAVAQDPTTKGQWILQGRTSPSDTNTPSFWRETATWSSDASTPSYETETGYQLYSQTFGQHAWLMYTGSGNSKVMVVGGQRDPEDYITYNAYLLWDPTQLTGNNSLGLLRYIHDPVYTNNNAGKVQNAALHCVGQVQLATGKILAVGGVRRYGFRPSPNQTQPYHYGASMVFRYDPFTGSDGSWDFDGTSNTVVDGYALPDFLYLGNLNITNDTIEDRYYPTLVELPDGRVVIVGGLKDVSSSINQTTYRVYTPNSDGYMYSSDFGSPITFPNGYESELGSEYPRLHLITRMESGTLKSYVAYVGQSKELYLLDAANPGNNWTKVTSSYAAGIDRLEGASVLLPNANKNPKTKAEQVLDRVMVAGGRSNSDTVRDSIEVIDFSATKRYTKDTTTDKTTPLMSGARR